MRNRGSLAFPALLLGGLLVAALPSFAAAPPDRPDLVLRGSITGADHQTWKTLPFDVPEGVARITVRFDYTHREDRTTIDLGLLGPDGFRGHDGLRGYSGGNKREFTVAARDATPSYSPGPIRAGRWALLLGIPNIRRETRSDYTAQIFFSRDGDEREAGIVPPVLETAGRWYRGDLHMHTAHSDGACASQAGQRVPCPLFLTLQQAAARGLDFVAVSEHNTASHAAALRELQVYYDRMLLLPAREITTFQGHANLFGHLRPVDFRLNTPEVPDWNSLLRSLLASDAFVSINHPVRPSGEECMGCGWTPVPAADLHLVQGVEVVNSADAGTPFSGLPFWQRQLDAGYRLTALAGSDNHDASLEIPRADGAMPVGQPLTVIHASSLSTEGLLEGMRSGRVFVDVGGDARARHVLDLKASNGEDSALMGGVLTARRGESIEIEVTIEGLPEHGIALLLDGRPLAAATQRFRWRADGRPHTLRAEVRDAEGRLVLIGNPIYFRNGR